jgi:uncharacterized RDD family membrane protein YckC
MSIVRIATNFNIDIEFISPPFYKRLFAWLIDLIIQVFYLVMATRLFTWISSNRSQSLDSQYDLHFIGLLLLVPFFIYHLVSEIMLGGQSIGKKITGIRVISENGGKPGIGQYIIRWLIRTSDVFLFIMLLLLPYAEHYGARIYWGFGGALLLLASDVILVNTRNQQRLGDILAHTLLINTRQRENINDTIFQEISGHYTPRFPQVMQLSDKDINSLKSILDTAKKGKDHQLAELASDKIRNHLHIETELTPFVFLEVLLKDYNYLSVN